MEKLRIIIGGFLGIMPAGGVTWDYMQYPLGFSLLGHDVYYIEDTRLYPVYQKAGSKWNDSNSCVEHVRNVMEYFQMNDRWAYRDEVSGKCFGMNENKVKELCRTADLFVNISCSTFMRDEYRSIPKRILIDSDPMFTQIQYVSQQMFTPGQAGIRQMIHAHNYLFTFGENIGATDCLIPVEGLNWYTTRQPICLNFWKPLPVNGKNSISFTTLMNWSAGKKLSYDNKEWGQKDIEFLKFISLPKYLPGINLSMIVSKTGGTNNISEMDRLKNAGWKILSPETHAGDWISYQKFIKKSTGEFSVAKETYVEANTGWFSCRSACYLASGKPVVTQDTGWSKFIPTGSGLFSFKNIPEAIEALQKVAGNIKNHIKASRQIAEEYFDSNKVLRSLLQKIE